MGRESKTDREAKIVTAIRNLVDGADSQVVLIKNQWRENYDMFVYGSRNEDKEEWQTMFSVNKLQASTRTAQGRLVNTLVNTPDWMEICPRSDYNSDAAYYAPIFEKILKYYLDSSKFKRHAGTFFLCSLISTGNLHIGWKPKLVQNPKYIIKVTEEARRKEQARLAKSVENPQVEPDVSADELESELSKALDEFVAEAQGETIPTEKVSPYIQIGGLDLMDINHEKVYWDPNVMYMEDSLWRAFRYEVNRYELNYAAKLGLFNRATVNRIGSQRDASARLGTQNLRYKNTIAPKGGVKSDIVELLVYEGPLIIDNEVVEDNYFCVIANESTILKEGEYPYWEPPGQKTAVITAAVRQIPFRATGAGIGDNAVGLQKLYDSNWQLICDTFRYGIAGINVVNWQNLVDKGQLLEGVYPGMTLEVRGKPSESFEHIDFTSNIENQAHPVQNMLEQAIDSLTGINELMVGGSNPYSRTAAAETNARLDAGQQNVNIIALDLEQNFLIPALEKCLARVLQFGIPEININPELRSLLTEEELAAMNELTAGDRIEILNQWYKFKIKGFSSNQDKNEATMRDNELIQIVNSGGPLSAFINPIELMKEYFKNRGIKDPDRLLIVDQTPYKQVLSENEVLMASHMVMPSQNDDHEFHLKNQSTLAQSPSATPEMQQHVQFHMQMLQAMQMQQQAPGQGAPPPQM